MSQARTAKERVCFSRTQKHPLKENKRITSGNWKKAKDVRVLAERNPAVAAVGVWVESGDDGQEHPAVQALLTEERLEETRREKEESLRKFQDAVRERVSQQARLRKQQQLLKSYETVECESKVLQTSKAVHRFTPQTNLFPPWTHGERVICSPSSRCVSVEETESASSSQHTHHVSKLRKQVRHRLAARQTVQDGDELSELPGGRWKISTARDKPETHTLSNQKDCTDGTNDRGEEDEQDVEVEDEMLFGRRDQPLHLHHHRSKTVTFQNEKVYEPDPTASCTGFTTDFRASQVLWPHENQEELRRQRQSQFLMYRRHFMDTERQQVKEHQRHRKHLKRTARIKNEKEQLRKAEEMKMEQQRQQEEERKDMAEREYLILERLRLDEEEEAAEKIERRERTKKIKESKRYVEAMQALMKEKLKKEKVELPPLCCCGDTFWDSNPDTCANNCIFYNNPKAYAQALQSVLLSCELKEGGRGHYSSTWKPSMDAHSHRK